MTDETTQDESPPAPRDRLGELIASISRTLGDFDAQPAEAVEAMAFLVGRVIIMASAPGQIEANVESAKASIISSIAGHMRAQAADAGDAAGTA